MKAIAPPLRRGISLVELVIVILLLGIVGSVATLRYADGLHRYRAERTAQLIAGQLETARTAARSRSQNVTLTFDATNDRYTVVGLPNPDRKSATYVVPLNQGPAPVDLSSASFGGDGIIVYSGFGMPDSGGSLTVRSGNRQQTVTVVAGTGAVTIP